MAISLSGSMIEKKKQSIADKLADQAADLQKQPWWKTVGNIAIPLLATAAMGPLGGALAGYGGFGAGAINLLGGALTATGGGAGILGTLGQTATKALYNIGVNKLKDEALDAADKRSEKDIKLSGPSETLWGRDARDTLRKQYRDAKEAEKGTGYAGSILSAMVGQGLFKPGAYKEMFDVGFMPPGAPVPMEGLIPTDMEAAKSAVKLNELRGVDSSPLQKLAAGETSATDFMTNKVPQWKQNMLDTSMDKAVPDIGKFTNQPSLVFNPPSPTITDQIVNNQFARVLPNLQGYPGANIAGPDPGAVGAYGTIQPQYGPQATDPQWGGPAAPPDTTIEDEYWNNIMDQYYNYEDIPEGWE